MIRWGTILGLAAGSIAFGDARISALSATDPVAVNPIESTISQGIVNAGPESAAPASPVAREPPVPRGNPLWAVPLSSLSVTGERPIFSPSRRPPPPAVVAAPRVPLVTRPPVKPEEPDHPLLTLVGTVSGETEGIGIFLDQSTNNVIRLRTGENYTGWILRSIQGREASFEKDDRTATLALPASGAEQSGRPSGPVLAGTQTAATWTDGDGQQIGPPPATMLRSIAAPPVTAPPVDREVN